ncbi:4-hydroxy-tetrahydrodipicolinate reductase [Helicobacter sp. T3_23-1056]
MARSTEQINIGLLGSTGRVGRLLIDEIAQSNKAILSAMFVREKLDFAPNALRQNPNQNPTLITNDLDEFIASCEVIIDFSARSGTASLLSALQKRLDSSDNQRQANKQKSSLPKSSPSKSSLSKSNPSKSSLSKSTLPTLPACVIGTTGLSKDDFTLLDSLSKHTPILYAANMSLGVAILRQAVQEVASKLQNADIEISEIHHRFKKDAPSGTALALAHSCAKGRGLSDTNTKNSNLAQNPQNLFITDRASAGERKEGQISIVSLRGGDVAGRHTVGFYMQGEYLEFTHNATNRATFAKGALECALWLSKQKPNLYDIDSMLA